MPPKNTQPGPNQEPLFTMDNEEQMSPPADVDAIAAHILAVTSTPEHKAKIDKIYPATTRHHFPDRDKEAKEKAEDWRLTPEVKEVGRRGVVIAKQILDGANPESEKK